MAQISDYTDYKTGTTSEEQSKLVETGKVVFSGKTTDNGDYQTKSVALSELKSAGVPDIGTDTNRGKFLGVKENADELQWVPPLQIQNNDSPYGGYTSLIGNKSTIKLFSGLYYNKDSAGIGIKCDTNGGLVATKANGIGISTTNSHTGDVLTMTADGIVWAAPTATIDTTGAQEGYVLTYTNNTVGWSAPSGGDGGGQIVIDYDLNTDTATYNNSPLSVSDAITMFTANPNMVLKIPGYGIATPASTYTDNEDNIICLTFAIKRFDSSGSDMSSIIINASLDPGPDDGPWSHKDA